MNALLDRIAGTADEGLFAPVVRQGGRLSGKAAAAAVVVVMILAAAAPGRAALPLPGTEVYRGEEDLAERTLVGLRRFLLAETERSVEGRAAFWARDLASPAAYGESVAANRERLRRILGVVDPREPVEALEMLETTSRPARLAETERFCVYAVRWPAVGEVHGEGLLLEPQSRPRARIVALPDADQTPESLAGLAPAVTDAVPWARLLAEQGCQVLIPVLVDRDDTFSGNELVGRFTNQPHREWIHRQAYQAGRHVIGYEVQKVLAAVDWFAAENADGNGEPLSVAVAGYGEGALVAFYAAAVDTRIDACLVSGYFGPREGLWQEPIYRNVWGLLREFGDAEIASLVVPRSLVLEASLPPRIDGPPPPRPGRSGAAPGEIAEIPAESIRGELTRLRELVGDELAGAVRLIENGDDRPVGPGSVAALTALMEGLGIEAAAWEEAGEVIEPAVPLPEVARRQEQQVRQMETHVQRLIRESAFARAEYFWKPVEAEAEALRAAGRTPPQAWDEAVRPFRARFWDEVIGRLPPPEEPRPRTRRVIEEEAWTGYLVVLDVWPGVVAWGYLLLPNGIEAGERRPVVVCQHGISGVPEVTIDPESRTYGAYAARLAEEGFVVFTSYQPNRARGAEPFLVLQRIANPIEASIYSTIVAQNQQLLAWLGEQPFVDPQRIAFYGLSYGGKTAMRVPAMLEGYAVSICSADYNEWVRKVTAPDAVVGAAAAAQNFSSYMFTGEYEIMEFNLAHTFNYAEMAAMIAPRAFMVERGHDDRVASDEWVAFEYAPVRRLYTKLGIPRRTAIEWFDGGHVIHAEESFAFLREMLRPHDHTRDAR